MGSLIWIEYLVDSSQGIALGIIRGIGKQNIASLGTFISFYVFSVPLAYIFAFPLGFRIKGLWIGMICGLSIAVLSYNILINFVFDWNHPSPGASATRRRRERDPD
jgi:MATE family multidrug resistance protein